MYKLIILKSELLRDTKIIKKKRIIFNYTYDSLNLDKDYLTKELSKYDFSKMDNYLLNIKISMTEDVKEKIDLIISFENNLKDKHDNVEYINLLKAILYKKTEEFFISNEKNLCSKKNSFLIVKNKNTISKIDIDNILYIEIRKRDITIHTFDGEYFTRNSMRKMEEDLKEYNFFRCHKSFLVNIKYIMFINKDSVTISHKKIPVSKYRMSELKNIIVEAVGDILY